MAHPLYIFGEIKQNHNNLQLKLLYRNITNFPFSIDTIALNFNIIRFHSFIHMSVHMILIEWRMMRSPNLSIKYLTKAANQCNKGAYHVQHHEISEKPSKIKLESRSTKSTVQIDRIIFFFQQFHCCNNICCTGLADFLSDFFPLSWWFNVTCFLTYIDFYFFKLINRCVTALTQVAELVSIVHSFYMSWD